MPATSVQRNKKPFKKVKVDPVTIDIIVPCKCVITVRVIGYKSQRK